MPVLTVDRPLCVELFLGLTQRQFERLVPMVARRGGPAIADGHPGRQWTLPLPERVLLMGAYRRTDLTLRQLAPLFGVSKSAVGRVVEQLAPLLTLAPVTRRRGPEMAVLTGDRLIPVPNGARPPLDLPAGERLSIRIDVRTRLVLAERAPEPELVSAATGTTPR